MVATKIGTDTFATRIGDNATATNGTYEWYFLSDIAEETEDYQITPGTELIAINHTSMAQQKGMRVITWVFKNVRVAKGTDYDNLKKALSYWSVNNSLLYIDHNDEDSHDQAQISNSSQTLVAMRCRILKIQKTRVSGAGHYTCTLVIREYTS